MAAGSQYTVEVTVSNTGDVAGRDVVQLYYTPPYTEGGIEMASVNLLAFAKTDLIEPGESQTVTLTFDAYDLAYGNQLPSYIKSTYIDATKIQSPQVYAGEFYGNEFNVYAEGEDGSFSLFAPVAGRYYHMLEISYFWSTGAYVSFGSPAGARAAWDFGNTDFYGNVDFSGADVRGLSVDTVEGRAVDIAATEGDLVLSCPSGDIRVAASSGQIRFFVDGTTWYLDRDGLHK